MAKLSAQQVYALARQAGFDPQAAVTMTAIIGGESGFNAGAHNPNAKTGDNSYGLAQINMLGSLGPARLKQFGIASNEALFDPLTNLKAAFAVSGGGKNFTPWTVFTKGVHTKYLAEAQAAAAAVGDNVAAFAGGIPQGAGGGIPMNREQLAQRVRDQFPAYAWLLDVPEVGALLLEAVDPNVGFDESTLKARLYNTTWWKSHSESMRTWDTLKQTDPQSASQKVLEVTQEIKRRAQQLGLVVTDERVSQIADFSLRYGWSGTYRATEIDRFLMHLSNAERTGGGEMGAYEDQARALAARYLVPISDDQARRYAESVLGGEQTWDGIIATLSDQARAMYPQLTDAIAAGVAPADFAEPYRQVAAQTLEVGADAINMIDPKYLKALNGGEGRAPMTLTDWEATLRSDRSYGWQSTKTARKQAYEMGAQLMRSFGKTA